MKFLDKFILIPIERYERLLKSSSEQKKTVKDSDEAESTTQNNNTSSTSEKNPKQDKSQLSESLVNEKDSKEGTSQNRFASDNKKSFQDNSPLKQLNKIPPRPPGIPNKKRKVIFKWETLF